MNHHTVRPHHKVALALTAPLIISIGIDSAYRISTGRPTFITDDTVGPPVLGALVNGLLGVAFLALFWVVRAEAPRFSALGRTSRACRNVLQVGTALLGVGTIVTGPVWEALGVNSGALHDASGLVATAGLGLTALAAVVLGLTQVRHNRLGWGGRLLALILPVGVATALLAVVDANLASPVFLTACLLGGLASIGVHADEPAVRAAKVH